MALPANRMLRAAGGLAGAVAVWWGSVVLFGIPAFLLPSPVDVVPKLAFLIENASLFSHLWTTVSEILEGFVLGGAVGIATGILFVRLPRLERLSAPLILLVQTAPKIAIAPLLLLWLGLGPMPKVVLVAIVTFFPAMAGTMTGFRYIEAPFHDLARVLRLTRWQKILRIEVPFALPPILGSLRVASTQAVTAAVIGELMGANRGLGYLLAMGQENNDAAIVIAVVILLSLIGWGFYEIVSLVERIALSGRVQRDLPRES